MDAYLRCGRLLLLASCALAVSDARAAVGDSGPSGNISARACLLLDAATGKILFERNASTPFPPASTTKLMTALLVYERVGLRGTLEVEESDTWVEPSHVPLIAGETVPVLDLVQSLLIGSDNDTAMALGRHVGGSVPRFVNLMNVRARQLGCSATNFKNPNGLPARGQVTTCRDLMKIFERVLAIPQLRSTCQMRGFFLDTRQGRQWVKNHNRLLGQYPGMGPAKTGWTIASQHTFAAAAIRGGVELHLTILQSPDKWNDSRILFDYGFARAGCAAVRPVASRSTKSR